MWATQYAGGSNTVAGASKLVASGGGSFVVDHTLHRGGSVSGSIGLGASGPGVGGVYAAAIDADSFEFLAFTPTAADGSWSLANLAPGEVTVALVDLVALSASPSPGYRVMMRPDLDVLHLGLGPAYLAATRYTVESDETLDTGRQAMAGFDCDPATFRTWVRRWSVRTSPARTCAVATCTAPTSRRQPDGCQPDRRHDRWCDVHVGSGVDEAAAGDDGVELGRCGAAGLQPVGDELQRSAWWAC
ncbi:MAG: hypothetical protein R2699_18865 [Acidimicrobiales bacterium]